MSDNDAQQECGSRYVGYQHLSFHRPVDGVTVITLNRPEVGNAINVVLHQELGRVWGDVMADERTRAVVLTGAGDHFCMGGDAADVQIQTFERAQEVLAEILDIVYKMTSCRKPIVSAINGNALAGGVAIGLLADISVMAKEAWLVDGHVSGGLVAGDHSVMIWPLLCSLSTAKYYLMTGEKLYGDEAHRIGLITFAVPKVEVLPRAISIAERLARQPEFSIRWTKQALNHWMTQMAPTFEASAALEVLSFYGSAFSEWHRTRSKDDANGSD